MTHPIVSFHNSLTRKEETFTPLTEKTLLMYSCGPTVYDHIHIGNLRAYLVPDLVHRLFSHLDYDVQLTINFTDFGHLTDDADAGEDKIMRGMKRAGLPITLEAMREYVVPYIESFKTDNALFGNLPATNYTRASDYITEQITLIETLSAKGYAYETSDGLYFDIAKFPAYGRLGNIDLEKMRAGARVEVNEEKRHPADFALWKKGDLGWDSAWGTGFPGWHIECAAMAFATLGEQIDIHTGGEDLAYTHHNGEIAEAESVTGKPFSQIWLHNAFITSNDEKLAKSAGNGIWLKDLIEADYDPLDYRYWMLQSHYRTTANFSWEALEAAKTARTRLLKALAQLPTGGTPDTHIVDSFVTLLADDLDTPGVIAHIWEVLKDDSIEPAQRRASLLVVDSLVNLGLEQAKDIPQPLSVTELPSAVQELLKSRAVARANKDWHEADELRDKLATLGYAVEDSPEGPIVTKK